MDAAERRMQQAVVAGFSFRENRRGCGPSKARASLPLLTKRKSGGGLHASLGVIYFRLDRQGAGERPVPSVSGRRPRGTAYAKLTVPLCRARHARRSAGTGCEGSECFFTGFGPEQASRGRLRQQSAEVAASTITGALVVANASAHGRYYRATAIWLVIARAPADHHVPRDQERSGLRRWQR